MRRPLGCHALSCGVKYYVQRGRPSERDRNLGTLRHFKSVQPSNLHDSLKGLAGPCPLSGFMLISCPGRWSLGSLDPKSSMAGTAPARPWAIRAATGWPSAHLVQPAIKPTPAMHNSGVIATCHQVKQLNKPSEVPGRIPEPHVAKPRMFCAPPLAQTRNERNELWLRIRRCSPVCVQRLTSLGKAELRGSFKVPEGSKIACTCLHYPSYSSTRIDAQPSKGAAKAEHRQAKNVLRRRGLQASGIFGHSETRSGSHIKVSELFCLLDFPCSFPEALLGIDAALRIPELLTQGTSGNEAEDRESFENIQIHYSGTLSCTKPRYHNSRAPLPFLRRPHVERCK